MLITAGDHRKAVQGYRETGLTVKGFKTGILALDEELKLKLALGRFMVVTGIPGMGKSEVLDAIILNMALMHKWRTMYFSPENNPEDEHITALVEKYVGKAIMQCTPAEVDEAIDFIDEHIIWYRPKDPNKRTCEAILDAASNEKARKGLHMNIIDPWNYVTQIRNGMTISEYLSIQLNNITTFTRDEQVLTTVVAHPTNLPKDKEGNTMKPDLYTINDGAQWFNKMDYGFVIHRPNLLYNVVEVNYLKRKKKWMGKLGMVKLDYDPHSGRLKSQDETMYLLPTNIPEPFPEAKVLPLF